MQVGLATRYYGHERDTRAGELLRAGTGKCIVINVHDILGLIGLNGEPFPQSEILTLIICT